MPSQKRSQRNNERVKERRKKRKLDILDKRLEDQLYLLARIDPNTVEGQSKLEISRICGDANKMDKVVVKENKENNTGYISYLLSYIWG